MALGEKPVNPFSDYRNISDAELFEAMDLERPGLEEVRAAAAAGDFQEACLRWGSYFARRTSPRWYVDISTYGRRMKESFPKLAEVILSLAAPILDKNIAHGDAKLVFVDGKPDWVANPTVSSSILGARNLYCIEPLGRAFLITGRAEYADCYRMLTRTLYEQRNDIPLWKGNIDVFWTSELNAGLRAMHLLDAYLCVRQYDGLTAEDHEAALKFLLALAENEADIDRGDKHNKTPNQRLCGMCALGIMGVALPEFHNSAEWLRRGVENVSRILESTVYADGAHVELCTQYHMAAIRDSAKLSRVLALNGRPGLYGDMDTDGAFRRMHTWMARLVAPDGFLPPFHSGVYATEWLPYLMAYERFNPGSGFAPLIARFYGPDFVPVAKRRPGDTLYFLTPDLAPASPVSGSREPDFEAVNLQPSGACAMRSGQGKDAMYLATLYGRPVGGHGYPQFGSFVFYANGVWPALHPGSPFAYTDPDYHRYFHTTLSHNTVTVDGKSQARVIGEDQREIGATCEAWAAGEHGAALRISHPGYLSVAGVMHTRTFFFVNHGFVFIHDRLWPPSRVEEKGERACDWTLHTGLTLEPTCGPGLSLRSKGTPGIEIVPAYPAETALAPVEQRPCMLPVAFEDGLENQLGQANQYRLRKTAPRDRAVSFGVGLFPLREREHGGMNVKPLSPRDTRNDFEAFEVVARGKRYVILVQNESHDTVKFANVETAAPAAVARMDNGQTKWIVEATP